MRAGKIYSTIDIVVARQAEEAEVKSKVVRKKSNNPFLCETDEYMGPDDIESEQPLSLLAMHDEEDLINLSSAPLRPENATPCFDMGNSSKVIRIFYYSCFIYENIVFGIRIQA